MTNEQMAAKLRELARDRNDYDIGPSLEVLSDTIDPPKPEPGTVVWWRRKGEQEWLNGLVEKGGYGIVTSWATLLSWNNPDIEWKPVRLLDPRQVAVDVPPVSEWSDRVNTMQIQYVPRDVEGFPFGSVTVLEITRNQAERMEEQDDDSTR